MARIRTIKPEFFDDETIAALSFQARLAFIGLLQQADREGRLRDRPVRLKARMFPYDDLDIVTLLDELERHRFIRRYTVGGEAFIAIRTFTKHQQVNQRETASVLPAPPEAAEHSLAHAEHVHALGGREGNGREQEGKGTEESAVTPSVPTPTPSVLTFPTVGSGPTSWALTVAQVVAWQTCYQGTDVEAECRKALAWVQANRPKTAKGMPAFLVNWLNRAVQRGGNSRPLGLAAAGTPTSTAAMNRLPAWAQRAIAAKGGAS